MIKKILLYFFEDINLALTHIETPQKGWFLAFITRFKKQLSYVVFLSFILTITALISPLIVMGIYSKINTADAVTNFEIIGLGIFIFLIIDLLFRFLRNRITSFIGARISYLLSTQVFKRVLSLSPSYTENASVGSQIVRLSDFNSIRSFIEGSGMISLIEIPFFLILFVGLMLMAGSLAFIPFVASLLLVIFALFMIPFIKTINMESAVSGSKKQAFLIEFFSEFRTIRMSGLSSKFIDKFEKISAASSIDVLRTANINSIINNVSQAMVSIAGLLTIGLGVVGVVNGELNGAILIAAMMLVWKILSPLTTGLSVFAQSARIIQSIKQLNALMAMPLETMNDDNKVLEYKGNVVFNEVSLRYRPDYIPAVMGISFGISEGEFVVVKGHEGSGKTTMLKLLMGMYRSQTGMITIDGTNIQQVAPSLLRRSIAYLPQEDILFNVSIEKNMKYYSPDSSYDEIRKSLDYVGLVEEIDALPDKTDTQISFLRTHGNYSSLRRRLCIARTFLNDSNLVLLDEPDLGLTKDDFKKLQNTLDKLKSTKTFIISTNNPSIIKKADKVITMNMGVIANIEATKKWIGN